MSGFGEAAAAALYVASNIYSWREARNMPKRQADANRQVLELQKQHYDAISREMRDILRVAVGKYLSDVDSVLNGFDFEDAYPEVPAPADFVPVDACCMQGATIECNIGHVDRADAYARFVNRRHEENDLIHALSMDPGFLVNLDIQSRSIQTLMRGNLPVGDVVEIMTDNAEQAALSGRIGNTKKTTARDLGISKLRTQAAGRAEFREATSWANSTVSPLQRQEDIRSMMQNPAQRIQHALQQAILIQNSLQNKNNALAQKEPFKMAKLQTKLQKHITELQYRASEAMLTNQFVPNYASVVVPKTDNTAMLLGGIGSAIQNVNSSWFYGGPSKSQEGYRGEPQNSTSGKPSEKEGYDWSRFSK
jgi:hypothetical protein